MSENLTDPTKDEIDSLVAMTITLADAALRGMLKELPQLREELATSTVPLPKQLASGLLAAVYVVYRATLKEPGRTNEVTTQFTAGAKHLYNGLDSISKNIPQIIEMMTSYQVLTEAVARTEQQAEQNAAARERAPRAQPLHPELKCCASPDLQEQPGEPPQDVCVNCGAVYT